MSRTTVALLSTKHLLHNLSIIKEIVKPAKIIAMVKANAYGHGLRSVSLRLDKHIDMFGVASIDEALALREVGITANIMLAEGIFEQTELIYSAAKNFHVVFHNENQLRWLEKSILPLPLQAWVKVNTGMGRLGFNIEHAKHNYWQLHNNPQVAKPVRIMSHFACSNDITHPLNKRQIHLFQSLIGELKSEFSICNSAAIFHFAECHYDYVRPGLCLYGVSPIRDISAADLNLKPVMTLQTSLIAIRMMRKGEYIGYGAKYCCPEDMQVGIITCGYGDGYPITAVTGTPVLINNIECPLIGIVSMDMSAVDLRPLGSANINIGDPVILWGNGLPVERIAAYTTSIPWAILSGVQHRVKYIWTQLP